MLQDSLSFPLRSCGVQPAGVTFIRQEDVRVLVICGQNGAII